MILICAARLSRRAVTLFLVESKLSYKNIDFWDSSWKKAFQDVIVHCTLYIILLIQIMSHVLYYGETCPEFSPSSCNHPEMDISRSGIEPRLPASHSIKELASQVLICLFGTYAVLSFHLTIPLLEACLAVWSGEKETYEIYWWINYGIRRWNKKARSLGN